jgi:hypothetical protein
MFPSQSSQQQPSQYQSSSQYPEPSQSQQPSQQQEVSASQQPQSSQFSSTLGLSLDPKEFKVYKITPGASWVQCTEREPWADI